METLENKVSIRLYPKISKRAVTFQEKWNHWTNETKIKERVMIQSTPTHLEAMLQHGRVWLPVGTKWLTSSATIISGY